MRRVLTILAAAALAAAGCSGQEPSPEGPEMTPVPSPTATTEDPGGDGGPSPSPSPTGPDAADPSVEVAATAFTECEADRYTVGYPEDWSTNPDDGLLDPCEIFHPGEIEVPEEPRDRDLHYAVSMYVDAVDFEDRVAGDAPDEVLEERETTVDGRRAHVLEFESTGQALTPEGERSYTYAVDLDGEILVATTSSVGETDYERDKRVLDRMMTEELTVHGGPSAVGGPATTDLSTEEPDGWPLVVTDVRVGAHDGFDRLVFDIAGEGRAGWRIEYDDDPKAQGSGRPVQVAGDAVLRVTLRQMAYPADAPAEPYDGPERIEPTRTEAIVEVVESVLYEGYHDFFVGLDEERPYRVARLSDPQRVVIDIETD